MHKQLEQQFVKDVESLNEGQLLTQTFGIETITQDTVKTFKERVVTGRGSVKAFGVYFVGAVLDLVGVSFTFSVNGKSVNEDLPAVAYSTFTPGGLIGMAASMGTQRIPKTAFPIPEGSTLATKVTSGSIAAMGLGVKMFVVLYFTELFIPRKMLFNLVQNFEVNAISGTQTTENFVLPTARGRIVGLTLFTNTIAENIEDNLLTITILINGVVLHSSAQPSLFLFTNEMIHTNGWIVNIEGGAVLTMIIDSGGPRDVLIGTTLFFSEMIASKRSKKPDTKQLPIS